MMQAQEFEYDRSPIAKAYQSPRRLLTLVLGSAVFVLPAVWLLRMPTDFATKIAALSAIVFFGGGALLALIFLAVRPMLGAVATMRVDANGLTFTSRYRALVPFGRVQRVDTLPWSNIEGFRIVDTRDMPSIRATEDMRKSLPLGNALPSRPTVRFVGVIPRDIKAALASKTTLRAMLARRLYKEFGVLAVAGPVVGLTNEQLVSTLEGYRAAFSIPTTPST